MRKILTLSVLTAAIVAAGCSRSSSPDEGMTADLERDLALATSARPQNAVVSAIEGGPTEAPSGRSKGMRGPVAVRKRTPKPSPSPVIQEVAAAETAADIPAQASTPAVAEPSPAPAPVPEAVVIAPASEPVVETARGSGPSAGNGDEGARGSDGGSGGGRRGGGWGVIGVIIRGGAGGVDHCEKHDGRRRGGGIDQEVLGRIGGGGRIGGAIGGIAGGIIRNGRDDRRGDDRAPVGRPTTYPRY